MRRADHTGRKSFGLPGVLSVLLLFLAFLSFFAGEWYIDTYGKIGFDSVLYTLTANLGGVSSGLIGSYLEKGLVPTLLLTAAGSLILFLPCSRKLYIQIGSAKKFPLYPLPRWMAVTVCVLTSAGLLLYTAVSVEFTKYLYNISHPSTLYQDEYRAPDSVSITFPEEKRNLIYIYLESMETTFLSTEEGGALPYNLIPELHQLAQNNVNFSEHEGVGGFFCNSGASWTIGSLVSQTAGVPLKVLAGVSGNDYGQDGNFLPGLTNLTDILHQNGYYQVMMCGSDASFGGRLQYYTGHGIDRFCDYYSAIEDGIIPEDYYVWWGIEDAKLYDYAKQELTGLAAKDQPFSFTMLTVDTHHIDGYLCQYCTNEYSQPYENVIRCASRQLDTFIQWLQQQDFYENTTIIIVGDHPTMDGAYISANVADGYLRRVYNCFINSAVQPASSKNREFCALDLFPTTLAAMGCTIEGNRLGLGTNLFSEVPTLAEEMGLAWFNVLLTRHSSYYFDNFYTS